MVIHEEGCEPVTLYGEITVPSTLMQGRQAAEVERLLEGYGLLPLHAQARRWQLAAERSGYMLTYTFHLMLTS